jgi:hypothetical protein
LFVSPLIFAEFAEDDLEDEDDDELRLEVEGFPLFLLTELCGLMLDGLVAMTPVPA